MNKYGLVWVEPHTDLLLWIYASFQFHFRFWKKAKM